jgi:hypothetical protein
MAGRLVEMRLRLTVTRADGRVEDLGTVGYFHRHPLRRLLWRVGKWLRKV